MMISNANFYHSATKPKLTYFLETNSIVICDFGVGAEASLTVPIVLAQMIHVPSVAATVIRHAEAPAGQRERRPAWHLGSGLLAAISRIPAFAVVVFIVPAMARAEDKTASTVSPQQLKAKTDYCNTCHGLQGQGFRGSFPMPRLAGQQPVYIENQLKAFIDHRRKNQFNVAHALSPAMLTAVTTEFKDLNPKPLGSAPADQIAAGKKIYDEGVAERNIQACASCHGPEAKGDGQFPRLAGQLYEYVTTKLANWDNERGQDKADPDTSAIMQQIADHLTSAQIAAVAAYVSTLE